MRKFVLAVMTGFALACSPVLAQSTQQSGIPYPNVAAALAALKAKPGVKFADNGGWTIVSDTDGANWSFTPRNHYAHPSVGRRELHQEKGRYFVVTRILCEAPKPACDRLNKEYELLNQRMNEAIQRGPQKN